MSTKTQNFAKFLRHGQTEAEKILWGELRSRRCGGYKFRRQVRINRYIVDFLCVAKKIIIEVDGPTHDNRQDYDNQRTDHLEKIGYHVIRFKNEDIYDDINAVVEEIYHALQI